VDQLPKAMPPSRPARSVQTGRRLGGGKLARPDPALSLALVGLYLGLEWLSFLHEHDGLPVTPWNPGLGLMFAVIILKGTAYGIVFFASVVLAAVLVSAALWFLEQPVGELVTLYESTFALSGLGLMGALNLVILGGLLGLAGAWLAVSRHLVDIEPR